MKTNKFFNKIRDHASCIVHRASSIHPASSIHHASCIMHRASFLHHASSIHHASCIMHRASILLLMLVTMSVGQMWGIEIVSSGTAATPVFDANITSTESGGVSYETSYWKFDGSTKYLYITAKEGYYIQSVKINAQTNQGSAQNAAYGFATSGNTLNDFTCAEQQVPSSSSWGEYTLTPTDKNPQPRYFIIARRIVSGSKTYGSGQTIRIKQFTVTYTSVGAGGSTYSVTYNGNGKTLGNVPVDGNSYASGDLVTVLDNTGSLAKTGYTFAGWNTAANGSGNSYAAGDRFGIFANTTLYAMWEDNAVCPETGIRYHAEVLKNCTCSIASKEEKLIPAENMSVQNGAIGLYCIGSSTKAIQITTKNSELQLNYNTGDVAIHVILNCELAAGDVISWTGNNGGNNYQMYITQNNSAKPTSSSLTTTNNAYTVTSEDGLAGKKEFYLWRGANNMYLKSISVTRPAPSTPSYYYRGSKNSWGATEMTKSTDGYYYYISGDYQGSHEFKITPQADSYDNALGYSSINVGFNGTDITNDNTSVKNWYNNGGNIGIWTQNDERYYIIVYPKGTTINTTSSDIVCASSTLPNDYSNICVVGDAAVFPGGWNPSSENKMDADGGTYSKTISIATAGTYEFKIYDWRTPSSKKYYGWGNSNGSYHTYTETGTKDLYSGDNNLKLQVTNPGNYTFLFNTSNNNLTVTYPARYTVTVAKSNDSYGSVSQASVENVQSGTSIIFGGSGALAVGSTNVTATPAAETAQYTYAFTGWTSSDYTTGGTVTKDGTVRANFSRTTRQYDLTFDSKGGSAVANQTIAYGGNPAAVTAPTKLGYTFDGWSETDGGDVVANITSLTITGAKTLYAKWSQMPYATTANFAEEAVKTSNRATESDFLNNKHYSIASSGSVTVAWDNGTSQTKQADEGLKIKDQIATLCFWVAANKEVTITAGTLAGSNNGTASLSMDGGANYTITLNGAATKSTGTPVANGPYKTTEPTLFVIKTTSTSWNILNKIEIADPAATWQIAGPITGNGWTPVDLTDNSYYVANLGASQDYAFKIVKKVGEESTWYTMNGIITSADCTNKDFSTPGGSDNNTTLHTTVAGTYRIDVNTSGEYPIVSVTYPTVHTVTIAKNNDSYGEVSQASVADVVSGAAISAAGATLTIGSTSVTATPAVETAEYTYGFTNWTWEPAGATITAATTATANFTRTKKQYTLTWQTNGGDALTGTYTSGLIDWGTAITPPNTPTKPGFIFRGWGAEVAATMPTNNVTYTAQWEKEPVPSVLTFSGEGVDNSVTLDWTLPAADQVINTGHRYANGFADPSDVTNNNGELTITYSIPEAWSNSGIEFALSNLTDVQSVTFEYQGGSAAQWVSLHAYLLDNAGNRWKDDSKDLSVHAGPNSWTSVTFTPQHVLWDDVFANGAYSDQTRTITAVGFIAGSGTVMNGNTFKIRNVVVHRLSSAVDGVKIVRKEGSAPADASDGTVVYNGTALTCQDKGLTSNTTYHYAAFAYKDGEYAEPRRWSYDVPVIASPYPTPATVTTAGEINYTADASTDFLNPERGFMSQIDVNSALVAGNLNDTETMIQRLYYIEDFRSSDLSAEFLTMVTNDLALLRTNGKKAILRFAYDRDMGSGTSKSDYNDATPERWAAHLAQLKPIFAANEDVIFTVQAGFMGVWGEWYYSGQGANEGGGIPDDVKFTLLDQILDAVPASRTVQVRYVDDLRKYLASSGARAAKSNRLGLHNDAYLNGEDNMGTYSGSDGVAANRTYTAAQGLLAPLGGETNLTAGQANASSIYNTYSTGVKAAADMRALHYTYLNSAYSSYVLDKWKDETYTDGASYYDIMSGYMGYRFQLHSATFPAKATSGAAMPVFINLHNVGYAPLYNARTAYIVLKNNAHTYEFPLSANPCSWQPDGALATIDENITLTGVAAGTYGLYLWLPDQAESIKSNPKYAIHFANTGVWDAETGYNNLNHQVTVTYSINYNANGATGSMDAQTIDGANVTLNANTFEKDGYHFSGWVADVDVTINSQTVTAGTLIEGTPTLQNIQSNITLTAQWEAVVTDVVITVRGGGEASVQAGDHIQLDAACTPAGAYGSASITWRSGDTNLATVDQNGLVTAKRQGDVLIYAQSGNGVERNIRLTISAAACAEGTWTLTYWKEGVGQKTQHCFENMGNNRWELDWTLPNSADWFAVGKVGGTNTHSRDWTFNAIVFNDRRNAQGGACGTNPYPGQDVEGRLVIWDNSTADNYGIAFLPKYQVSYMVDGSNWRIMDFHNTDGYEYETDLFKVPDGYKSNADMKYYVGVKQGQYNHSVSGISSEDAMNGVEGLRESDMAGKYGKWHIYSNSCSNNWFCQFIHYSYSYELRLDDETVFAYDAATAASGEQNKVTITSETPSKTGYTFRGWDRTKGKNELSGSDYITAGSQYGFWANNETPVNDIFYPVWQANSYNIIYKDKDDAEFSGTDWESAQPTQHIYGTATTLVNPTKTGYTFDGWYTTSACTGDPVTTLAADGYTANITLYAKWTALPAPEVTWTGVPATVYAGGKYSFTVTTNSDAALNIDQLTATGTASLDKTLNGSTITVNFTMAADADAAPTFTWAIPVGTTYQSINSQPSAIALGDCAGGGGEPQTIYEMHLTSTTTAEVSSGDSYSFSRELNSTNNAIQGLTYRKLGDAIITLTPEEGIKSGDVIRCQIGGSGSKTTGVTIKNPSGTVLFSETRSVGADKAYYQEYIFTADYSYVTVEQHDTDLRFYGVTITRPGGGSGEKQTANLAWSEDLSAGVNKTVGDAAFTYTAASDNSIGAITYSVTSGSDVADVNATTGEVTIKAAGDAVITATLAEVGCFNSNSVSYNLHVESNCTAPVITSDLSTTPYIYIKTAPASALEIAATGDDLHYQWYSNTTASTESGTTVGEDVASYTPATTEAGTKYYYCVVSSGTCTTTSAIATVTVNASMSVTLEGNGGTDGSVTLTIDNRASNLQAATRDGYTLLGYYTTNSVATAVRVMNPDGTLAKSISGYTDGSQNWVGYNKTTLYAMWSKNPTTCGTGAMTWNLEVGAGDANRSTISTPSTSNDFSETGISTLTNLTANGLAYDTDEGKQNLSVKVETPATYDADKYLYTTFTVEAGYTFTPCEVVVKAQPVTTNKTVKVELTDGVRTISTEENLLAGGIANVILENGGNVAFEGTVTLKIYCYGAADKFRIGSPITVRGTIEETCISPALSWTTAPANGTVGDADATILASSALSSGAITYDTEDHTVAMIVAGKLRFLGEGTTNVIATIAANGRYCEQTISQAITVAVPTYNLTVTDENSCSLDQPNIPVGREVTVTYTCAAPSGMVLTGYTPLIPGGVFDAEAKTYTFLMPNHDVTLTAVWKSAECVNNCIIKYTLTGQNSGTTTGSIGGSSVQNVQNEKEDGGYKLGSDGHYVGMTLATGNFAAGDIVIIENTKGGSNDGSNAMRLTTNSTGATMIADAENWQVGENEYILTEANVATPFNSIYVARTSTYKQNPYIKSMAVYRLCDGTYMLRYDMKGIGQQIKRQLGVSELPEILPIPEAKGYNFIGWYTDATCRTQAVAGAAISAHTTLYAKWEPKPMTCTGIYNYADHTTDSGQTYTNPNGGAPTGSDGVALTTPWTMHTGTEEDGINSVVLTNGCYDNKSATSYKWISSYIKMLKEGSGQSTLTINMRQEGVLKMYIGGYSANATVKVAHGGETKSQSTSGVATREANYSLVTFALAEGENTVTVTGANAYIAEMNICINSTEEICDAPEITVQPQSIDGLVLGADNVDLTVEATAVGEIHYQWYTCNSSGANMAPIADAKEATLNVVPQIVGTTFYRCVLTSECGSKIESRVAYVRIVPREVTLTYHLYNNTETALEGDNFTLSKEFVPEAAAYMGNATDMTMHGTTTALVDRTGGANALMSPSIAIPTTYDENEYVSFSFDVAEDYCFQITESNIQVQPALANATFKIVVEDELGVTVESNEVEVAHGQLTTVTFPAGLAETKLVGTITLKIYGWSATENNKYRFDKTPTLTGELHSLPAPEIHWTAQPQNGRVGKSMVISAASSDCNECAITYTSETPAHATVTTTDGVTTLNYVAQGTSLIYAHVAGDGKHYRTSGANVSREITVRSTYDAYFHNNSGEGDHKWSTPANWSTGVVPYSTEVVLINADVTVDATDAVAEEVVLNSGAHLTIEPTAALSVAEQILLQDAQGNTSAVNDPSRILIESDARGTGALIHGDKVGETMATVEMYSKARHENDVWYWQWVTTPFSDENDIQYNYYGTYMRHWPLGEKAWVSMHNGDNMVPFEGYEITREEQQTFVMQGTLVGTADVTKTAAYVGNRNYLFGNSWTAPINISEFLSEDFENFQQSVVLFNAGTNNSGLDANAQGGGNAGTYVTIPINQAGQGGLPQTIPSMQTFQLKALKSTQNPTGSGEVNVTFNYDRLVRTATPVIEPMRAPGRAAAEGELKNGNTAKLIISVAGMDYSDRTYLFQNPVCTADFDNGWDGVKVMGETYAPQLFVYNAAGNWAVSTQDEIVGSVLGFRKGSEDSFYTMTFEYVGDESLCLYDSENNITTPIVSGTQYYFNSDTDATTARFEIRAYSPSVTTGVDGAEAEVGVQKVIIEDKLFIIRDGHMYNATGAMVK